MEDERFAADVVDAWSPVFT